MVPLAPTAKPRPPEIYRLEAFASTAPEFATNCVVFVKFDLAQGTNGIDRRGSGPAATPHP